MYKRLKKMQYRLGMINEKFCNGYKLREHPEFPIDTELFGDIYTLLRYIEDPEQIIGVKTYVRTTCVTKSYSHLVFTIEGKSKSGLYHLINEDEKEPIHIYIAKRYIEFFQPYGHQSEKQKQLNQ